MSASGRLHPPTHSNTHCRSHSHTLSHVPAPPRTHSYAAQIGPMRLCHQPCSSWAYTVSGSQTSAPSVELDCPAGGGILCLPSSTCQACEPGSSDRNPLRSLYPLSPSSSCDVSVSWQTMMRCQSALSLSHPPSFYFSPFLALSHPTPHPLSLAVSCATPGL